MDITKKKIKQLEEKLTDESKLVEKNENDKTDVQTDKQIKKKIAQQTTKDCHMSLQIQKNKSNEYCEHRQLIVDGKIFLAMKQITSAIKENPATHADLHPELIAAAEDIIEIWKKKLKKMNSREEKIFLLNLFGFESACNPKQIDSVVNSTKGYLNKSTELDKTFKTEIIAAIHGMSERLLELVKQ